MLVAHEQQRRAQVDDEADPGHGHDDARGDGRGLGQALRGLQGDGSAGEDQQQGVGQGGQHRGLAIAVGATGAGVPARQPGGAPGHGQAQHIGQIVPRVGHQGGRAAPHPRAELDADEGQVDDQADGVAPVAGVDRAVVMAMTVRVAVTLIVVAMVMVVRVVVRVAHEVLLRRLSRVAPTWRRASVDGS